VRGSPPGGLGGPEHFTLDETRQVVDRIGQGASVQWLAVFAADVIPNLGVC